MTRPKDPEKLAAWTEKERARSAARSKAKTEERRAARECDPGMRTKFTSTLTDGSGNVTAEWHGQEPAPIDPPKYDPVPEGFAIAKVSTMTDRTGKVLVQHVTSSPDRQRVVDFLRGAAEHLIAYEGKAQPIVPPAPAVTDLDLQNWYLFGDIHWGMLAWAPETEDDNDLRIAERDLLGGMSELVDRSPHSESAVVVNIGDMWHAQNDAQLTPGHGHKLDVDSRAGKVAALGLSVYQRMLDKALEKHRTVYAINVKGNHDPDLAVWTSQWIRAWYRNEPRLIVVDNYNPQIYRRFGKNMIALSHGDGLKPDQVPVVAAADEPVMWGETEYRYGIQGHIHHLTRREFPGMVVETLRTLAPGDYYARRGGWRSGRACACMTLHKEFGETGRTVVGIKQAREARP